MANSSNAVQTKDGKLIVEDKTFTPLQLRREFISLKKTYETMLYGAYCHRCGQHKSKDDFYKSFDPHSQSGVTPICKQCVLDVMERVDENGERHEITEESCMKACSLMDKPFLREVWELSKQQVDNPDDLTHQNICKTYVSNLCQKKYRELSFVDSDVFHTKIVYADEVIATSGNSRVEGQIELKKDIDDVVRLIGFDPFANENPVDQQFLYSQLLGLLDSDEDSAEDMMKIHSAISIVRSFLQLSKIDDAIAKLMLNPTTMQKNSPDIGRLQESKLRIQNGITKLAAESCISLKNNREAKKGDKTWTGKIKKIKDMNLRCSEVNGFDLKTCKAMEQVMDISNRSILKQLRLDESEWSSMVAEQREMLSALQKSNAAHKEISRILLRENLDLKEFLTENDLLDETNTVDLKELYSQYGLALNGEDSDE